MEQILGHRSGGVLVRSPLQFANAALGGRVAGLVTAIAATTLTDANANWVTNVPAGHSLQDGKLVSVHSAGAPTVQRFNVVAAAGTANTVLTMIQAWTPSNPSVGDDYFIQAAAESGSATGGTASTLTDSTKAWTVNCWMGFFVCVNNSFNRILSNTATVLTVEGVFNTNPAASHAYAIVMPLVGNYSDLQRGHSRGIGQWGGFGGDGSNSNDV
jgi:hypothetical protein